MLLVVPRLEPESKTLRDPRSHSTCSVLSGQFIVFCRMNVHVFLTFHVWGLTSGCDGDVMESEVCAVIKRVSDFASSSPSPVSVYSGALFKPITTDGFPPHTSRGVLALIHPVTLMDSQLTGGGARLSCRASQAITTNISCSFTKTMNKRFVWPAVCEQADVEILRPSCLAVGPLWIF